MVDFHSHILPEMDDGSESVEMSLAMLRESRRQGVDLICSTSHFYADEEDPASFLARRGEAYARLREAMENPMDYPRILLGAEVLYFPGISVAEEVCSLRLEGTPFLLVEPPMMPWSETMLDEVELYEASSATIREGIALAQEEEYLKAIEAFLRVEESSTMYGEARENIDSCVSEIVKAGVSAESEEECLEAIAAIDEGIALLPENGALKEGRDECQSKYRSLVRERTIAEADELAANGDYEGAFERLNEGLEVLAEDEQLGEKVTALRKDFIDHVTRLALGKVDDGDFGEAGDLVEESLEIYSCGELGELRDQIEESEEWSAPRALRYNAGKITYTEYPGEFKEKDKKIEYSLKAAQSGRCEWEFTRMESALKVQLIVKGPDGEEIVKEKGLVDGSKVYCDLEKDENYSVEVTATEGKGGYVLLLGQNKATADISSYDSVTDSIEYKGQLNGYTYIPEVTGTYRFDVECDPENIPVSLVIYDSRDSKAGGGEVKDGGGFAVEMTSGAKYRIEASNSGKASEYTFSIGKPETSEDITGRYVICGATAYSGQKQA